MKFHDTFWADTARILVLVAPVFLAGCAGLDVFEPKPDTTVSHLLRGSVPEGRLSLEGPAVVIGPSTIARHLDQPAIVTYPDPGRVDQSIRHRWAEPLRTSIDRLLVEDLAGVLQSANVATLGSLDAPDWQFRVAYQVQELGGPLSGPVTMKVSWRIVDREETTLHATIETFSEPVPGSPTWSAYVEAVEAVIQSWAAEVGQHMDSILSSAQDG